MYVCEKSYRCCEHEFWDSEKDVTEDAKTCGHLLEVAPVVHAHWTSKKEKWHDGETYCSACGAEAGAEYGRYTYLETEYCPHCGARMDEREET